MFFEALGIGKSYGGKPVLEDVSFSVKPGEIVSIIGPSGVGKTTLLKIIAGLERADAGELRFARPPSRRHPVILVFQDYLLFPNLTVAQNVAFGLTVRRLPRAEVRERVEAMLAFFHLKDKARAWPVELSAGQRQRVAIARAMVVEPAMLLLDEPFANLDRTLKLETAEFIRATQKTFSVPTISVTHDLEEAFVMSDRIGLVLDGRLVQFAEPREVYFHPSGLEAARFLGPVNALSPGQAVGMGMDLEGLGPAGHGPLLVRPEAVEVVPDPDGPCRVEKAAFAGHYVKLTVCREDVCIEAYSGVNGLAPGDRVRLRLKETLEAQGEHA